MNHQQLTPREQEVLALIAQGLSSAEVGSALYISPRTVQVHLQNMYTKLHVKSRTALVAKTRSAVAPPAPADYSADIELVCNAVAQRLSQMGDQERAAASIRVLEALLPPRSQ